MMLAAGTGALPQLNFRPEQAQAMAATLQCATRRDRGNMRRLVLLVVLLSFFAFPARAQCIEDNRQFQLGHGVARLKGYLCRTKADTSRPSIRVTYLNLEEPLASLVLEGRSTKHITTMLGKTRVFDNEVAKAVNALRGRFGRESNIEGTFEGARDVSLVTVVPGGGKSETEKDSVDKGMSVVSLPGIGSGDHPDIDGILHVTQQQSWPKGYAHYYTSPAEGIGFRPAGQKNAPGVDMLLWRYFNADDAAQFPARVAAYNRWIKANVKALPEEDAAAESQGLQGLNEFERFVLAGGIPADYSIVYGGSDSGCGNHGEFCCWNFGGTIRTPSIDVVIVHNEGSKAIRIDSLLGVRPTTESLRTRVPIRPASVTTPEYPLPNSAFDLQPGERALIPLRLRFDVGEKHLGSSQRFDPSDMAGAKRGFQKLQSYKPETEFSAEWTYSDGSEEKTGAIKKVRESFEAPTQPKREHLVFGPEWRATGLEIAGERLVLASGQLNVLALSVGMAEGSCPFLMAWNAESNRWTEYGKMLHKATGKALEQSDVRVIKGFRGRFRLEEREAEIAHVDSASLAITLKSGKSLELSPDRAALSAIDGDYVMLMWQQAIEFTFALPRGIREEDVVESRLTLSGYYERYSTVVGKIARMRLTSAP